MDTKVVPDVIKMRKNNVSSNFNELTHRIYEIAIEDIRKYPYNYPPRSEDKHQLEILEDGLIMAGEVSKNESGIEILMPLPLTVDFGLGDGHGRLYFAEKYNLKTVPCIFKPGYTQEDLYVALGASQRPFNAKAKTSVYFKSPNNVTFPDQEEALNILKNLLGMDYKEFLFINNITKTTNNAASYVLQVIDNYFMKFLEISRKDYRENIPTKFAKNATIWLIKNDMVKEIRGDVNHAWKHNSLSHSRIKRTLTRCITKGEKLTAEAILSFNR
jgi:hypothetical protein